MDSFCFVSHSFVFNADTITITISISISISIEFNLTLVENRKFLIVINLIGPCKYLAPASV